ncbi:MAG: class I SAM-dependent methyltransferase [Pseudomonadota bacterium]
MSGIRSLARNVAVRSPFAGFAQRWSERRYAKAAPNFPEKDENGVPIPPAIWMATAAGHTDWQGFLRSGEEAIAVFSAAIERHGGDFENAERVLDFGCGCGRLARYAPSYTEAEFFGVDYNHDLLDWCDHNLPGCFSLNKLHPPLTFPENHFDVIYLLSVFTHLRIPTQTEWLKEFQRIVKPGGFCLITFRDEISASLPCTGIDTDQLERDGFAYHNNAAEGSNLISTFQTNDHLTDLVSPYFELCEIIPSTHNPITQAIAILRKQSD